MIIGKYNRSVIMTYVGTCLSLVGMACISKGLIKVAMICLIYAGICDLFDGTIARRCKRTTEEQDFGIQIDTLADMISFVAFPLVIGVNVITYSKFYYLVILMFYMLAGIIRLSWFNMNTKIESHTKYYQGLPVTYIALIMPLVYFLQQCLMPDLRNIVWLLMYLVVGGLFILDVKVKKPSGIWYIVFSILAVGLTIALIF